MSMRTGKNCSSSCDFKRLRADWTDLLTGEQFEHVFLDRYKHTLQIHTAHSFKRRQISLLNTTYLVLVAILISSFAPLPIQPQFTV